MSSKCCTSGKLPAWARSLSANYSIRTGTYCAACCSSKPVIERCTHKSRTVKCVTEQVHRHMGGRTLQKDADLQRQVLGMTLVQVIVPSQQRSMELWNLPFPTAGKSNRRLLARGLCSGRVYKGVPSWTYVHSKEALTALQVHHLWVLLVPSVAATSSSSSG